MPHPKHDVESDCSRNLTYISMRYLLLKEIHWKKVSRELTGILLVVSCSPEELHRSEHVASEGKKVQPLPSG